jgi:signal transduction histidine kinase
MQFSRVEPNRTLALTRVNTLLGRVFSFAATLVGLQTFANAIPQYNEHQLVPFWFWLNFVLLAGSHLLMIYLVWVVGDGRIGFAALTLSTIFAMATWAFQLNGGFLYPGEQPWIWWSVGIAALSAVGVFNFYWSSVILVGIPTGWFFLQISEIGLPVEPWRAFQDACFSFLFSSLIAGFIFVMRYEAARVDQANQKSVQAAIELAKADAIHRERDRIDALVHDTVLTTLLVSSNANDVEAQREAQVLATSAIKKLIEAQLSQAVAENISVNSLFSAIEVAIVRQANGVSIVTEGSTDSIVPSDVAAAVTESVLQALANAIHHAGSEAKIEVFLKGNDNGFKIVVKDNGRGFRPSRVPKNRLGLKLSIIGRVRAVGGKVFIDSKVGSGTNVIIEWSAK